MNIFVTGANGFLGSHLVKHFVNKGNKIFATSLHTDRLHDIMDDVQYSSSTLHGLTSLEPRIINFKPDIVIHCAWNGGNSYSYINNSNQFHKNVPATAILMDIIKRAKIPHFLCIGSGAEYGNHSWPIKEQTSEQPDSLYGICKYMTKMYSQKICEISNIKWIWVRPFYIYGPNDVITRLIPHVINKCLKKEKVLLNECNSIADYLYIDDFVDGIDHLIKNKQEGIFNICSNNQYIVKAIVNKIAELTDNISNVKFGAIPERNSQPQIVVGENTKLKTTGWSPSVSLNEGLIKTIEYYKNL